LLSKAFLHLGAHKTATTFIQANLVANRPAFEQRGWRVIYFQKEAPAAYQQIKKFRNGQDLDATANAEIDNYFREVRADTRNIFFSSEVVLGPMSMMRTGTIYPHIKATAARLKANFAGRDVKIGFCIRDFAGYIESSYNWLVGNGSADTFESYIGNITPEGVSWAHVVDGLTEAFGERNVSIWTYEDFKKDSAAAFLEIIRLAGLDPAGFELLVPIPKNVSRSADVVDLLQRWNAVLRERRMPAAERAEFRKRFLTLVSKVPRSDKSPSLLKPAQRERFSARYQEELATIRRKWPEILIDFSSSPYLNKITIPSPSTLKTEGQIRQSDRRGGRARAKPG
jgi:hypothetical protein